MKYNPPDKVKTKRITDPLTESDLHEAKQWILPSVWFDGTDWIIAYSKEEAAKLRAKYYDDEPENFFMQTFKKLPDSRRLTIIMEDAPEGEQKQTRTCREWVLQNGKVGFLAGMDW